MSAPKPSKSVQTFGRKRNAVAVALCKEGKGLLRLNGSPLHLAEPASLRVKVMEPILLLGRDNFAGMDIRIRVTGGGHSSQMYAVRQALAKAVVAYTAKCEWPGRRPTSRLADCWARAPARPRARRGQSPL